MSQDPLVSTAWLAERLNDPKVRVVDMRGYVVTRSLAPGVEEADYRGAFEEYLQGHIPGAIYVDWTKDIINPDDPVPVQIAPPERFAQAMGERGIGDDTTVVAVDHAGGQFATRLWWALNYYGHEDVKVLDGGWGRWVEEERPIEQGPVVVESRTFHCRPRHEWRIVAEDLKNRLDDPDFELQLLDGRDGQQYSGRKRRGPRGGRIPGAVSLSREKFFSPQGGFRPLEEIAHEVQQAGFTPDRPVIAYCNGGVAATVALFSLHRLGFPRLTNYDGSWNEWSGRQDLPIDPGEAPSQD